MKLVSIAERKQFRICKMQKHKITKMQKGAKSIFPIDKETHIFCSENEDVKPKIGLYIVRKCAENIPQMMKWDTPKGKMGHPKWRNGT